jgi:quercetin dioxygenase-like cupin family protein
MMTEHLIAKFEAELARDGFDVGTKTLDPSVVLDDHSHDFNVRGLVTAGDITITAGGETRRYALGERFTIAAGRVHSEIVGPDGVSFLVGRRHR